MPLSHTTKESIKTALAMTLVYGISLEMDWDRPYWAGFAVAFISLNTIGQSLNKGILRLVGSVLGAIIALILISLFPQDRWLFILAVSIWFFVATYLMMGKRYPYLWHMAAFVSLIICIDGGPYPDQAFSIAKLRVGQTALGIVVYTLVSTFLWPNSSRSAFKACVLNLLTTQQKLFKTSFKIFSVDRDKATTKSLRTQEVALLKQFGVLLTAAETDSEKVREVKQFWRDYQVGADKLAYTIQRWRDNLEALEALPLQKLLPTLDAFAQELANRSTAVEQLLRGETIQFQCTEIHPEVSSTDLLQLSHFNRAAVLVAQRQLQDMERLSQALLRSARGIHGTDEQAEATQPIQVQKQTFVFEPERLLGSVKLMAIIWVGFIIVFYTDAFPGGFGLVTLCGSFGLVFLTNPQIPASLAFRPSILAILLASLLYFLLMPQLSTIVGLGIMVFTSTFLICYYNSRPQQFIGRAAGLAFFLVIISVANTQSYSFSHVADTILMLTGVIVLLTIFSYTPFSPRPERVMLRLLKRYLRSTEYLLSTLSQPDDSALALWRKAFYQSELASLPGDLDIWVPHADASYLGAASVQQLPALTASLQEFTYRLQDLLELSAEYHSNKLHTAMHKDMLDWQSRVSKALQQLATDPSAGKMLVRGNLDNLLTRVEERMTVTMKGNAAENVNTLELENFYCLLAAYRELSDSLLNFTEITTRLDWSPWHEERFA